MSTDRMECLCKILAIFIACSVCSAKEFWDDLGVTWDANVLEMPTKLPRTETDAFFQGWSMVDFECEGNKGFKGYAMVKRKDEGVTLLFDKQGTIAGIQAVVNQTEAMRTRFPAKSQIPPFVRSGDRYLITAYFVDPALICSTGRSQKDLEREGTGTNLYLQNGRDEILEIPRNEIDVRAPWVEGRCFITMGVHYWYGINEGMDCNDFFPMFLLYNGRELNGFGWLFTKNLQSKYYEHPNSVLFPLFMKKVPRCLMTLGTISVLHIFLDKNPALNFC